MAAGLACSRQSPRLDTCQFVDWPKAAAAPPLLPPLPLLLLLPPLLPPPLPCCRRHAHVGPCRAVATAGSM